MCGVVPPMAVKLHGALQRIGELHLLSKQKKLTEDELIELNHCMNVNAKFWLDLAYLQNWSLVYYLVNDIDAQYDICRAIDDHMASLAIE